MADTVEELSFTNDTFTGSSGSATYSGNVFVNYTQGTYTGSISVLDSAGRNSFNISGNLTGNGPYQLSFGGVSTGYSFTLGWPNQAPTSGSANYADYTNGLAYANGEYGGSGQTQPITSDAVACFCTGAMIRTARGEVAVEELKVGDLVVTGSGSYRTIRWIGNQTLGSRGSILPEKQQPVLVTAGAFGFGLPVRDLMLSPGHLVLVDADTNNAGGHLVPIACLMNGITIDLAPVETVTYWHVELDGHDIVLANGLPAESYFDDGLRGWFADGKGESANKAGAKGRCRPEAVDGPVLEAEHRRLHEVIASNFAGHRGSEINRGCVSA